MKDKMRVLEGALILEISEDRTEAFITIRSSAGGAVPDSEFLTHFLHNNKITDCIIAEELDRVISEKIFDIPVCVARGKKAVYSKNGEIKYLFRDDSKEKQPEDGNSIDHKKKSNIKAVSKGEGIARLLPPTIGEDGYTVFGEIIPAGTGVEKKLPSGKNIFVDENDPNLLVAAVNGAVLIVSAEKMDVVPLLDIKGNVDYSVGNIDFTGSLIIRGDVLSGFVVRATGSIQVFGVIEDAEVYAGGNVFARACIGRKKGRIGAGGSVSLVFAENSRIDAGMDVTAQDYLINCEVQAGRSIIVSKKRGLIVGGKIISAETIEANIIGNKDETPTIISAGFSSELRQQLMLIDEEQTKNINSLGLINKALVKLNRLVLLKKTLTQATETQIRELVRMKNKIEESISTVLERQEEVISTYSNSESSKVRVLDTLYGGVKINFPDFQRANKDIMKNVMLMQLKDGIKIFPAK